ncbi:GntR family transcriptional regulator [Micromonospora sp. STR1s_5]|nr:GntR family transcriptional regulator [Micromonospora sp. STR1s_5]
MPQTMRFKSTADYATAEIQRRILAGELVPGSRVDQIELAQQLEVSRHPVRQAIERLAERGFINLHPHRSAVVAEISVEDMDELYGARRVLEDWALRECASRHATVTADEIAAPWQALQKADPTIDLESYMVANRAFHLVMYRGCGNRHMLRTIISLFDLSERYQRAALQETDRAERSQQDHAAMVEAIGRGDAKRLRELAAAHNAGTQATVQTNRSGAPER